VGFDIDNNGGFHNFFGDVFAPVTMLNINGSMAANAFGINRFDEVVGTDGNDNAFLLRGNRLQTFIPGGGTAAAAFGINDNGNIVGQFTMGAQMPGFFLARLGEHQGMGNMGNMGNGFGFLQIDAPSGPDVVNAQSINLRGQVVGFYVGTDGQQHGLWANVFQAMNGKVTATAVPDPMIPMVAGEPGATFVFSQILSVNDNGIAVGYYGDSTTSQHGFFYNLNTGQYTFLDDPSAAFSNGVEVTQITGITDAGEITGFYSDANGVFHGFFGFPGSLTCPGPQMQNQPFQFGFFR